MRLFARLVSKRATFLSTPSLAAMGDAFPLGVLVDAATKCAASRSTSAVMDSASVDTSRQMPTGPSAPTWRARRDGG